MSREKLPQGPDRTPSCATCVSLAMPRPARALFGDPPQWCANHDPAQAERRKLAGKRRDPPRLTAPGSDPRSVPTIDWIVDRALELSQQVASGHVEAGAGRAASMLLGKAIDALKARGSVGDLTPHAKPETGSPAPPSAAPTLGDLERGLDS